MALIRRADLRGGLLAYYRYLDSNDYTYQLMSTAYRDAVRARMDPDLQLQIRAACRRQPATTCVVDTSRPEVVDYLRWLEDNEMLADGLRRVIVQWTRGEDEFSPAVETRTRDLRVNIAAALVN